MFDKQYRFTGSHANKVSELTSYFDEKSKSKIFARNLDVYINAPIIGFLYQRKAKKNSEGDIAAQNIFAEQMINSSDILKYNLRLIILLDKQYEPDKEKRIDKAFRHFGSEEDLELFDSYVLGGVDVLYEKLIEGHGNPMEYINRMYDFMEDFHDKFNSDITRDEILKLCSNSAE